MCLFHTGRLLSFTVCSLLYSLNLIQIKKKRERKYGEKRIMDWNEKQFDLS